MKVKDIIKRLEKCNPEAFDVEDANLFKVEIEKALAQEKAVTIDFKEIDFFSAVFFNHADFAQCKIIK